MKVLLLFLLLPLLLANPPALAGNKKQSTNWATIYQWCANEAPEYLFDAAFDEWMDACLEGRGKKRRRK
jgi:hypothetical protein